MRRTIRLLLLCLAQTFTLPVCAQDAAPSCSAAAERAASTSCSDAVAGTWGRYPFSALFDSPPDQGISLALAGIMIAVLALRAGMR